MKEEETFNLEEAFLKLEETIADLEREDITLEQSFKEYQKGMELLSREKGPCFKREWGDR